MKIGVVAARTGVAVHVLRHWEDEGVVVPDRTAAGHRDYTEEHVSRLRIVRSCQRVGLSLASIRLILHRDEAGRTEVIERHLQHVRNQKNELDAAEAFLTHVLTCRHDLMSRCDSCSAYAAG
ncbi:MerR family transcriptional regulator [Aeromicrobium sp. Root495]|nr:MerR family transcriptional regulator [Aeromicrobium sp. Root495]